LLSATPASLTNKNTYLYCDNNPVMRIDANGDFWFTTILVASLVGAVVSSAIEAVSQIIDHGEIVDVGEVVKQGLGGATSAAITTTFAVVTGGASIVSNVAMAGIANLAADTVTGDVDWTNNTDIVEDATKSMMLGAACGLIGEGVGKAVKASNTASFDKLPRHMKKKVLTEDILGVKRSYANRLLHSNEYRSCVAFQDYISRGSQFASTAASSTADFIAGRCGLQ